MPICHILRRRAPVCLLAAFVGAPAWLGAQPDPLPASIVNGAPEYGLASVGMVFYDHMECSATLIGCQTVLTAAHCLCYDDSFAPPRLQLGDACRERPRLVDPAAKRVFFPHAGTFGVSEIVFHPGWGAPGGRFDLAILRLDRPVTGVRPAPVNDLAAVPVGTEGTVAGFGRTSRERADQGIKRSGRITTSRCGDDFVCWWLKEPVGPLGESAGACYHDSGGAVFVDLGSGPVLAGVNYSTSNPACVAPAMSSATAVYAHRSWIAETAGPDLGGGACGGLPAVGRAGTWSDGATGVLSESRPEAVYTFAVPAGTGVLRVTTAAAGTARPAVTDLDLLVLRASSPAAEASPDCASRGPGGVEVCEVLGPEPGTWYARLRRVRGEGRFQITVTRFDGSAEPQEPAEPPPAPTPESPPSPPAGRWITAAGLPGFEAKVLLHGGGTPVQGAAEPACVAETVCVSGAVPGRPELFLKVVGPRPNGFLWLQIARFTPSRTQVWLRRQATGRIGYYELEAVGPEDRDVPGLQDRRAFPP